MNAPSDNVFDATAETFDATVVQRSFELPVLVDFWAPWCGPCRSLTPVLERVVDSYAGKVVLAKVNTDEQQELATRHGIRSLPTVRIFRNGEAAGEFMGAQPEAAVRGLIEAHLERPSDRLRASAVRQVEAGDPAAAAVMLREAVTVDPEHWPVVRELALALAEAGAMDDAREVVGQLPAAERDTPDIVALTAHLALLERAAGSPSLAEAERGVADDPANLDLRYQLSALQVLEGNYESAMDQLLEVMRRDRSFRDDAARKGMLEVFDLLGNTGPLVKRYRRMMASALH